MLRWIICRAAGHRVNRRRVWHDGIFFRTRCARCRRPLIRRYDGWHLVDLDRDTHIEGQAPLAPPLQPKAHAG